MLSQTESRPIQGLEFLSGMLVVPQRGVNNLNCRALDPLVVAREHDDALSTFLTVPWRFLVLWLPAFTAKNESVVSICKEE